MLIKNGQPIGSAEVDLKILTHSTDCIIRIFTEFNELRYRILYVVLSMHLSQFFR